jgi:hypothetical protein
LRYRGRAETSVADNFIAIGEIAAAGADHIDFEGLLKIVPVALLGEYVRARTDTPDGEDPRFYDCHRGGSKGPSSAPSSSDPQTRSPNAASKRQQVKLGPQGLASIYAFG